MNQSERLDYLVRFLCEDSIKYKTLQVEENEKRMVMRSLMNVRMPKKISQDFLNIQDQFLQKEAEHKGVVKLEEIPTIKETYDSIHQFADKISIWQGDITRLEIDGIVNAANSQMIGCFVPCHRCIDNAIHSAAGIELREVCNYYMQAQREKYGRDYEEPTGMAMVTSGFNLPAEYVIHTVGPIVSSKLNEFHKHDLKSCYKSCMDAALENGIRSIAFCCISTGEFHFPNDEAAKIAVETVNSFLNRYEKSFDRIIFNVFKEVDLGYYKELLA